MEIATKLTREHGSRIVNNTRHSLIGDRILLRLLHSMETATKSSSEHRSSVLLQVTGIVPADLDYKNLLPKNGFYIKVSDSTHSMYVRLPSGQDGLVLGDQIRLGQFVYVDRLEVGSPVPVVIGVKPVPGRHSLVGGPVRLGLDPFRTSIKDASRSVKSMSVRGRIGTDRNVARVARSGNQDSCNTDESNTLSKIKSVPQSDDLKSQNGLKMPMNLPGTLSMLFKEVVLQRDVSRKIALQALTYATATETLVKSLETFTTVCKSAKPEAPAACFEAFLEFYHQIVQTASDVIVVQAPTGTSPTETTQTPKTKQKKDNQQVQLPIMHKIIHNSVDQSKNSELRSSTRRVTLCKSLASFPQKIHQMTQGNSNKDQKTQVSKRRGSTRSSSSVAATIPPLWKQCADIIKQNNKQLQKSCNATKTINLLKEIEREAGNWFMEFLEKAIENGINERDGEDGKSKKVPQELIQKVINWIEVEHFDSNKRALHLKAAYIARKLRIKMKNPECICSY